MKRLDWTDVLILAGFVAISYGLYSMTPGWAMVIVGIVGVLGGVLVGARHR